jgi:hypothetical protein
VSVVMAGGAPRPFIGARGGRGKRLGGGSSVGAIDGGGRPFQEGNWEPCVGFEGGGGEAVAVSGRGEDDREVAARARADDGGVVAERSDEEDEGGGARTSVREREGGGLGRP